ncbi:MAG: glycosyltransferase family A protein [Firmicutes bacterium]|nr:glycosyltransferase family A protein [Bacillota bacterium]
MGDKLLTVFTPTYNRAYRLKALYKSLINQTSYNFCWHIIDDGSSDNTKEVIDSILAENKLDIRYEYQTNAGKHAAHNKATKKCDTELFFCVDSDDELTADAVATIEKTWSGLSVEKKKALSGIVAYRGTHKMEIVGNEFPQNVECAGLSELYQMGKTGDTALIFRTEVIKKYPFPIFDGERFLRESLVYDAIDKDYSLYVMRKIIYLCEYLEDGLSHNATRLEMESPHGAAIFRLHEAEKSRKITRKIRNYAAFVLFSCIAGELKGAAKQLGAIRTALLLPIAGAGYIVYRIKGVI